ncbi:hypothetical protein D0Z00_002315 [Geotrichum galactomycetum]|uniref:Uncharacterized protein n=1 Tax=Geotrichum galactomycetum TaxID=27317 RepID=A0ACB6V4L2_9ASCO|nr:hypothetical protein D0Z00_002315 [Geotrichum candidum]
MTSETESHVDSKGMTNAHQIKIDPSQGFLSASDFHALHIAVQAAPLETIRAILTAFKGAPAFDINSIEPSKGDTPLHVAARYGRSDVVMYLLSLDGINDTVTNFAGKQPVEVARTPELAEAMQVVRAQYVGNVAIKMKRCFATNDIPALEELLSIPRAATLLDINGQDPDTGSTVLHDFVKARNIPMVEFILSHGGDPFRRNSKGILPIDATKDETIKRLLKQATKSQTVMIQTPGSAHLPASGVNNGNPGIKPGDPATYYPSMDDDSPHLAGPAPSMKGFLKKWTNFTSGYKLRWFVLEDGVLSYYKRQDDTESACRGAINMKQARLHLDSTEKLQFEVISKDSSKFHLKADHPVETSRWVWALTNAIQYAKDQDKLKHMQQSTGYSSSSTSQAQLTPGNTSISKSASSSHLARQITTRSASSNPRSVEESGAGSNNVAKLVSLSHQELNRADDNYQSDYEEDDEEDDEALNAKEAPYSDEILSASDSITIGLSSVASTIKSLRHSSEAGNLEQADLDKGLVALDQAMGMINTLIGQYSQHISERENFYKRRIERDQELQNLWTTTIRDMELEKDRIEGYLHKARQQRKQANKALREVTGSPARRLSYTSATQVTLPTTEDLKQPNQSAQEPQPATPALVRPVVTVTADDSDDEDESDEEFYDAVDSEDENEPEDTQPAKFEKSEAIEKAVAADNVLAQENRDELTDSQREVLDRILANKSFAGYEDGPRKKLLLDDDDRPRISLWGVLKNLIGKDMTKMTLPVSFNECTNLLQRSAEDMEYTDLLEKAAAIIDDPGERLVYIAAYAASSYSSTIDRIAKPFNPLLGETFEYSRPDMGYRMFSEQVSHHPPIGALIAESPRWEFYGDSNVKSKFYGRSFDINPTGLWYLKLRPNKGAEVEEELYTFRKVTSSVVGIITGSPTVDNFGDMEITNHTLGYKCILKFKARGWSGSHAYELKGTVVNSAGIPLWMVRGKWSDKIYAKKLDHQTAVTITNGMPETGDGSTDDAGPGSGGSAPFVIWKVHDRPKAPFNLTPFAITLNALPERLTDWVAPTDTRYRPDQRAMEEGRYDDAADEKRRVEDKQRAARREREQEGIEYEPRYFEKRVHDVSGQEYWAYKGNYWPLREKRELKDKGDIF